MILSFIAILKCHDNRNQREIFNIVISPTRYYHKYCDYRKIHYSETFISVKYFQLNSTILVPVALLSDIVIILIIVIITLMIYRNMKFLLSPIPNFTAIMKNSIITITIIFITAIITLFQLSHSSIFRPFSGDSRELFGTGLKYLNKLIENTRRTKIFKSKIL